MRTSVSALLAGALFLAPAALASQQSVLTGPSHPEVVNLTLKGVNVMKRADLLPSIYTTASYCNSFILKPFCWISKSRYFYTKKYLDHKELERDVLRIRIFYWKRGYRETEVDTAVVARGSNQVGVTFLIKEGPPILVSNVVVNQATPLLSQREINRRLSIGKERAAQSDQGGFLSVLSPGRPVRQGIRRRRSGHRPLSSTVPRTRPR